MPKYDAYLLRIWQGDGRWTARLEHLPNGTVLRFHRRSAFLDYLRTLAGADMPPESGVAHDEDPHNACGADVPD